MIQIKIFDNQDLLNTFLKEQKVIYKDLIVKKRKNGNRIYLQYILIYEQEKIEKTIENIKKNEYTCLTCEYYQYVIEYNGSICNFEPNDITIERCLPTIDEYINYKSKK